MDIESASFQDVRLVTKNIRYDASSRFRGEAPWHNRKQGLSKELRYHSVNASATFICLQEVLHHQLMDIMDLLKPSCAPAVKEDDLNVEAIPPSSPASLHWEYIGVGRDDGKTQGEYSPILYQPAIFKLLGYHTEWLSPTPDRPSKGWDASLPRILTVGLFQHRESKMKIAVMSTHFDDQGMKARKESAKIILRAVQKLIDQHGKKLPILVAGDFNSPTSESAYQIMANSSLVEDTKHASELNYGCQNTYTGFGDDREPDPYRIDFCFASRNQTIRCYSVLPAAYEDEPLDSDHRAVIVDTRVEVAEAITDTDDDWVLV